MNREHLFKGKTVKEGKWIEGSLIIDTKGNCYIGEYIPLNKDINIIGGRTQGKTLNQFAGMGFAMVDKDTVCEFTGLTDKNGTKIFENDIVTLFGEKYSVKWKKNILTYAIENINSETNITEFLFDYYEVIGNIFDDKELLNG